MGRFKRAACEAPRMRMEGTLPKLARFTERQEAVLEGASVFWQEGIYACKDIAVVNQRSIPQAIKKIREDGDFDVVGVAIRGEQVHLLLHPSHRKMPYEKDTKASHARREYQRNYYHLKKYGRKAPPRGA